MWTPRSPALDGSSVGVSDPDPVAVAVPLCPARAPPGVPGSAARGGIGRSGAWDASGPEVLPPAEGEDERVSAPAGPSVPRVATTRLSTDRTDRLKPKGASIGRWARKGRASRGCRRHLDRGGRVRGPGSGPWGVLG